MAGYIDSGQPEVAIKLFESMHETSVVPNDFTFTTAINACAILADHKTGRKIHARVEIFGYSSNLFVSSSLVDMYGKSNDVDESRKVFDSVCYRNIVSWTSMIAAYAQNAQTKDSLHLFGEFIRSASGPPNDFMLASVINACSSSGRLLLGKVMHGAVIHHGYDSNEVVATSLIDMYAKCGSLDYCNKMFQRIADPSMIMYTSMIVASAKYGRGKVSLQLFKEMLERGLKPNCVTFVGVLHACSHSGMIDEGMQYLNSMYEKHGIVPQAKHYTCVVDMLGRTGRLDEAYKLANSIKVDSNDGALLWGTLLSASRVYGRVDIASEASKNLIETNSQVAAAYVMLSNTYAVTGKWDDVHRLRSKMKSRGVFKEPGCSWVEIKDKTYVFYSGDTSSCERGSEVLSLLKDLEGRMKKSGYVGGSVGLVFIDVEEEAKEEMVGLHSERLALGFSLISLPKGTTIRIMKNLRMCRDCHEAFKLISEIVESDFIVRDINRFHHFRNGACTCEDFW